MYKVKSIEHASELGSGSDETWYRYVINNDFNTITCVRSGTRTEVQKHARSCVSLLNEKYIQGKIKTYKPVNIETHSFT